MNKKKKRLAFILLITLPPLLLSLQTSKSTKLSISLHGIEKVVKANKEQGYKEKHSLVDDSFLRNNVNISTEEEMGGLNFRVLNVIFPSGYLHSIY
jgi:hypothetical protein